MEKNNTKQRLNSIPIEKHETAAWADIHKMKEESRVPIPSEQRVAEARDYVEENQK